MNKTKSKTISNYSLWLRIAGVILFLLLLLLFLIFRLSSSHYKEGFQSLNELVEFGKTIDENRLSEGSNILVAEYTQYFQKKYDRTFSKILLDKISFFLYRYKLKQRPYWSSGFYKTILKEVTTSREKAGYSGGKFIQKMQARDNQKFIVFSDLFGSFHSLTRDLLELKKLGFIDETFHILSPNYYILFVGSIHGSTPYSLEAESVVLRLLKENPNNIFYLRSSTNYFDLWKQLPLKDELIFKIPNDAPIQQKIPLQELITRYFETLPAALYVMLAPTEKKSLEYVRFSVFRRYNNDNKNGKNLERLDELNFAHFLKEKQKNLVDSFQLKDQKQAADQSDSSKLVMKAIYSSVILFDDIVEKGLKQLNLDRGATSWIGFSAPVPVAQQVAQIFYDAFVVITTAQKTEDWTITVYTQDIRTKKGFETSTQKFFADSSKTSKNNKNVTNDTI